jgi:5-methylcytosine-specific restriction protein A
MSARRHYSSASWRRIRERVIAAQPICATPGCGQRSVHVDHIRPLREGGTDEWSNLRGLCPGCHSRVTRAGNKAPLRAVGCKPDGTPRDPSHWWNDDRD